MVSAARSTLSPRSKVVVRAIAEAMFSEDGEVEPIRLDAHVEDVDRMVAQASAPVRFGLWVALIVVRLAPLLLFMHARPLDGLEVRARVRVLERLERSQLMPLCLAFVGWRTISTLIFYEDPKELAALGYSGEGRTRHKRSLAVLEARPLVEARPLAEARPLESGVRLTDGTLVESEPSQPAAGKQEVA